MFILYHHLPLWDMDTNTVINVRIKKLQFQVRYMSNTELNTNKAFREQVEINLAFILK